MRDLRLEARKKDEELSKFTAMVLNKEDYITKLNTKIAGMGTRDLTKLNRKVVKKENKEVQTEERKSALIQCPRNDYGILDKLPSFDRSTREVKGKRKILNVSIRRGEHDKCFNCLDLEKKIKKIKSKIRKQISNLNQNKVSYHHNKLKVYLRQ